MLKNFYNKIKVEESFNNSLKLNQEVIAFQNDPTFIDKACSAIENICTIITSGGSNKVLLQGDGLKSLRKLEKIFTDRFGINVIVGINNAEDAYCYTSAFSTQFDYPKFRDITDILERLEEAKKNQTLNKYITGEVKKDISDGEIRDETGSNPKYKYIRDLSDISELSLFETVTTEGIKIDLKNAKILNAKPNQYLFVCIDFYSFYSKYSLTPKELLAILLHEIGHGWFEIEQIYTLYANLFLLNNLLIEEYGKNEKSPIEVANIFYNKTGLDRTPTKSKNITDVSMTMLDDVVRGSLIGLNTYHSRTDHEQHADEFASRFGLGAYVVSGLQKTGASPEYDTRDNSGLAACNNSIGFIVNFTTNIVGSKVLAFILLFGTPLIEIMKIGVVICMFLYIKYSGEYYTAGTTYDTLLRRYIRVRNTTVRRLLNITDKKIRKDILVDLDNLDSIIEEVKTNSTKTIFQKFSKYYGGLVNPRAKQEFILNELLEDMSANEINVALAKWNTRRV